MNKDQESPKKSQNEKTTDIEKMEADLRIQKEKVLQKWDELVTASQKHDEKLKLLEELQSKIELR